MSLEPVAERLLRAARLVAGRTPFRVREVELYEHRPGHPDPFAHRHPVQRLADRWYFHRVGRGYRGGSYKGVDLTAGDGGGFAGVLIRAIEDEAGTRTDGPSRVVDRLLAAAGYETVSAFDNAIGERTAHDRRSPLRLTDAREERVTVYRTPRVGLSAAKAAADPVALDFLARPYRFLTDPRRTRTGRLQLVVGLHRAGKTAAAIRALTGSPAAAVARAVAAYGGEPLAGAAAELCRLYGAADRGERLA